MLEIETHHASLNFMDRLRVWLRERGIVILHPGIASGGRITLLLRTPHGREIEVVFDPDDLEEDPEDTIEFIATILRSRPGNPWLQTPLA